MSDSRQQFEAWASRHHGVLSIGKVGEYYSNPAVNNDWFVWQASRAATVVELPHTVYRGDYLQDGTSNLEWDEYYEIDEIKSVLDAAGVSYQ